MKETYLSRDFRKTVARHFPIEARELNAAFDVRLNGLLAENADASKEERYHLKKQILPGIAERLRPFGGLCRCFCDSDDISYAGLHPKLIWHRTKTLCRGDDRCDFCMKIIK